MTSKIVWLGTDVATLCLFHPDDLAHRSEDPIAWYSVDFAYAAESRAGRLVAFATGSDGEYQVRLTTGPLTREEERRRCAGWTYPLQVRHGRIFLDNTDALPGEERMTDAGDEPERWFDLPDGPYRVTVHPIAAGDGIDEAAPPAEALGLPDYVVTFESTADLGAIAVAESLPDLRPLPDWRPVTGARSDGRSPYGWPRKAPPPTGSALFLSLADDVPFLPGRSIKIAVDDAVVSAIFGAEDAPLRADERPVILGPVARPGTLAVLARPSGTSRLRGEAPRLSVHGEHLVRLVSLRESPVGPVATFVPVERATPSGAGTAAPDTFKAKAVAFAAGPRIRDRPSHPSFERELLQALRTADAVTGWLIAHLDVTTSTRLALYALPDAERMRALEIIFDGGDAAQALPPDAESPASGWLDRLRRLLARRR